MSETIKYRILNNEDENDTKNKLYELISKIISKFDLSLYNIIFYIILILILYIIIDFLRTLRILKKTYYYY